MTRFDRRQALTLLGGVAAMTALSPRAFAQTRAKLLIIGGGFGGATAARQLKLLLPQADVCLVEKNPVFTACPFSNLVIGGIRDIESQQFGYRGLVDLGIKVIHDEAIEVDNAARQVKLKHGAILPYDRLVLSPGIDIRWNALEGYDEAASEIMPHGWKAGSQTLLLRAQLEAMPDGGLVVMTAPAAPYRCPPGPYERASLIAAYLKREKPRSKLLVLDAKDSFSKMPLFQEAWAEHYPDHLEWRAGSLDGRVSRVDASTRTVFTDFEDISGDVVNVIPPQKAGKIAEIAGVTDSTGWCPINGISFESTLQPGIHVIGDATIASPMPKSAFSANLQGKICALSVAQMLTDNEPSATTLANTCYSFITEETAISVVGVYRNDDGILLSVPGAGGISPLAASGDIRSAEAIQAEQWFNTITAEAFG